MFSAIFGKRRSSPVEEDSTPPIPGAKPDDGYVMIDPAPSRGNLYPSVSGGGFPAVPGPYPQRPAPPAPVARRSEEQTFHYLQGVPFTLCKELQMASSKDTISTETNQILVFFTSKLNMGGYDYDFSTEKSVLKEC